MHSKQSTLANFSRTSFSDSYCMRPDSEEELEQYLAQHPQQTMLVRGSGLSYNDSCFNTNSFIIDSSRFNHLISFDEKTGLVSCQGGVLLHDLFLVHPDFIPPVIPGTLSATVAGSIAHDVHGKNNHLQGSFGHHIEWLDLLVGNKKLRCSRKEHGDLFQATIAGLGLTGIITRVGLRMQRASRYVTVKQQKFSQVSELLKSMEHYGLKHDYQVAWLDLLHTSPRAVWSVADYASAVPIKEQKIHSVPPLPISLIYGWNMKLFNKLIYRHVKKEERLWLPQFNNPLDKLEHWNRLYGPNGLIQFQALFDTVQAEEILKQLVNLIRIHQATPTLSVLKLFTKAGEGLLSFCKPGFTIAIDFICNQQARAAVKAMNQLILEYKGQIYLAKDLMLDAEHYHKMDTQQEQFSQILRRYNCIMHSDLGKRLGILK